MKLAGEASVARAIVIYMRHQHIVGGTICWADFRRDCHTQLSSTAVRGLESSRRARAIIGYSTLRLRIIPPGTGHLQVDVSLSGDLVMPCGDLETSGGQRHGGLRAPNVASLVGFALH